VLCVMCYVLNPLYQCYYLYKKTLYVNVECVMCYVLNPLCILY
jgi:hypothetical protein